ELWQEGNILQVEGKVRVRDDRVQLSCDSAHRYEPSSPVEKASATPVSEVSIPVEAPPEVAPTRVNRLAITITQTSDKDSDIMLLHKVVDTLKEFPGEDEVSLSLNSEEKVVNLKLPNITTSFCAELRERLIKLVGENGLKLETAG
ncbi:MAG: hypothetical protein HY665_07250, partial [Chloroflexi bacterium]|nr:hypothetical protein [Chloroflexota bacterium]